MEPTQHHGHRVRLREEDFRIADVGRLLVCDRVKRGEHRLDVILQEVLCHQPADHVGMVRQGLVVGIAHFRRHLEPYVDLRTNDE